VKKLALMILLALGMTLSFSAIGLVMLFALKVVNDLDEVRDLLTGKMPGAESTLLKPGEVEEVQDALILLQQQKKELEQDLIDLKVVRDSLAEKKDTLSQEIGTLEEQTQTGSEDQVKAKEERVKQMVVLYNAMRPADAAAIMDGLSDDLIVELLPRLKERQAARILSTLPDDKRRRISELMLTETAQRAP